MKVLIIGNITISGLNELGRKVNSFLSLKNKIVRENVITTKKNWEKISEIKVLGKQRELSESEISRILFNICERGAMLISYDKNIKDYTLEEGEILVEKERINRSKGIERVERIQFLRTIKKLEKTSPEKMEQKEKTRKTIDKITGIQVIGCRELQALTKEKDMENNQSKPKKGREKPTKKLSKTKEKKNVGKRN